MQNELRQARRLSQSVIDAITGNRTLQIYLMTVFDIQQQTLLLWLKRKELKLCHPDALDIIKTETGIDTVLETV